MSPRRRNTWIIGAVSAAVALGVYIYKSSTSTNKSTAPRIRVSPGSKVSLVVNKSIIQQGMPLGLFLAQFPNLTIIVCPDGDDGTTRQLKSQIPEAHAFKVIPCDTIVGITHVLKHLRADQVILCPEAPVEPHQIDKFVGSVIQLTESELDDQIKQIFA